MYNTILFDLDGTLIDPLLGITDSFAYALSKWNIKISDRKELHRVIGPPLYDSFTKFYNFSESDANKAIQFYREYFKSTGMHQNTLYTGVKQLLSTLKNDNKKILLATSKPEIFAIEILKHHKIDIYFDRICGASMDGKISKKGDVIAYALKSLEISDLQSTVMIGDREHDILGAHRENINSIGVLYGYGSYEELKFANATHIAKTVEDISKYI